MDTDKEDWELEEQHNIDQVRTDVSCTTLVIGTLDRLDCTGSYLSDNNLFWVLTSANPASAVSTLSLQHIRRHLLAPLTTTLNILKLY